MLEVISYDEIEVVRERPQILKFVTQRGGVRTVVKVHRVKDVGYRPIYLDKGPRVLNTFDSYVPSLKLYPWLDRDL